MNAEVRRARAMALLLDLLVPAAAADAAALLVTAVLWLVLPGQRPDEAPIWAAAAAAALAAFLLRDASGGRARRWLGMEARDAAGRPPGIAGSIRRNLPLLLPGWNLFEAWPLVHDGAAARRSDRHTGVAIRRAP